MLRILVLSLFLLGCTTVKITDKTGSVTVEREFGVIKLSATPKEGAVYADISLIGYATTPLGQVLGYSEQSIAIMSENCKLVLWVGNSTNPSVVNELLRENESICVINSNKLEED